MRHVQQRLDGPHHSDGSIRRTHCTGGEGVQGDIYDPSNSQMYFKPQFLETSLDNE